MKTSFLDRNCSTAIKGIALIFMFIHHFFTFPGWYIEGIAYPELEAFARDYCEPLKLCVPVFAFLTGFFYAGTPQKNYRYALRKITDLLISYWCVYLPLLILAVALGCHTLSRSGLLLELVGLETPVMAFCWYVFFYIFAMLALPILTGGGKSSAVLDVVLLLILPAAVCNVLVMGDLQGPAYSAVLNLKNYFPCISIGYLFGKYHLFQRVFSRNLDQIPSRAGQLLVCGLLLVLAFYGPHLCKTFSIGTIDCKNGLYPLSCTMNIFYAPMFIFGASRLLNTVKGSLGFRILEKIGEQSLYMWFLHCVFFNVCKEFTQPLLYLPRHPLLVLLFGLLLCYAGSCLISIPAKAIIRLKNKLPAQHTRQ